MDVVFLLILKKYDDIWSKVWESIKKELGSEFIYNNKFPKAELN